MKVDWWTKRNPEENYNTILFVPPTPGSQLKIRMQDREKALNQGTDLRIKIVEGPGIKLKHLLVDKNP